MPGQPEVLPILSAADDRGMCNAQHGEINATMSGENAPHLAPMLDMVENVESCNNLEAAIGVALLEQATLIGHQPLASTGTKSIRSRTRSL